MQYISSACAHCARAVWAHLGALFAFRWLRWREKKKHDLWWRNSGRTHKSICFLYEQIFFFFISMCVNEIVFLIISLILGHTKDTNEVKEKKNSISFIWHDAYALCEFHLSNAFEGVLGHCILRALSCPASAKYLFSKSHSVLFLFFFLNKYTSFITINYGKRFFFAVSNKWFPFLFHRLSIDRNDVSHDELKYSLWTNRSNTQRNRLNADNVRYPS